MVYTLIAIAFIPVFIWIIVMCILIKNYKTNKPTPPNNNSRILLFILFIFFILLTKKNSLMNSLIYGGGAILGIALTLKKNVKNQLTQSPTHSNANTDKTIIKNEK